MVFVFKPNPGDITFAIIGGVLLSIAASLNLLLKGRGLCGIFGGLITLDEKTRQWKLSFISGLILATTVFFLVFEFDDVECFMKMQFFEEPMKMVENVGLFGFLVAGFMIGFGSRISRGCVLGHWINGVPRFSQRSWCAISIITPLAILVSSLRFEWQKLFFITQGTGFLKHFSGIEYITVVIFLVISCLCFVGQLLYIELKSSNKEKERNDRIVSFFIGIVFGTGLVLSGMMKRSKFVNLLTLGDNWDPSILITIMTCTIINFFTYYYIIDIQKKPTMELNFDFPSDNVDGRLVWGSIILGFGFGIVGLCILPAVGLIPIFTPHISLVFINSVAVGQLLAMKLEDYLDDGKKKLNCQGNCGDCSNICDNDKDK